MKLHPTEAVLYATLLALLGYGVYLAQYDAGGFVELVADGGPLSWMTTALLTIAAVVLLVRMLRYGGLHGARWWIGHLLLIGLVVVIGGENVRWGDGYHPYETIDIIDLPDVSEELTQRTVQVENRAYSYDIVLQVLLVVSVLIALVLPWLYRRSPGYRRLVDGWGIPVLTIMQGLVLLVLLGSLFAMPVVERWRLLLFGLSVVVLAVVAFPYNRAGLTREAAP